MTFSSLLYSISCIFAWRMYLLIPLAYIHNHLHLGTTTEPLETWRIPLAVPFSPQRAFL